VANSFDVIVVGGGPAGYVAAIRAAQLGLATAVVERDKLGGVCVNIGCIPTKALLASAAVLMTVRDASEFGVTAEGVKTDYRVAMTRSRRVSDQNSKGVEFLMKKNKITVVKGTGVLRPGRRVQVASDTLEARRAVILATGSRVKGLPRVGLAVNGTTVLSSDEALFLDHAPPSLAIIGAGAVGMEFADIFNAFGTRVTLLEALPRVLPLEDADSSEALARSYRKRKIDIVTGASVTRAAVGPSSVTLEVAVGGAPRTIEAAVVLVATGRAPNTEGLGLAEAGVQVTERGFVKVDQHLETTAPAIYAIGDVAGPPMLAHKGSREGVNAVERVAGLEPHPIRYDNVPSVTYCSPEVASIGLTEEQAKGQGLAYSVGRFPFSANARARCSGETEGFVKILRDTKYGEILGAHIVGSRASELIHELVVARENEYTAEEVELAIHAHPTLAEAVAQATLDSLGRVTDL
jgi:dihydrolipoamide dehydrogenase